MNNKLQSFKQWANQNTPFIAIVAGILILTVAITTIVIQDATPVAKHRVTCTSSGNVIFEADSYQKPEAHHGSISYKDIDYEWQYVTGNCYTSTIKNFEGE